MCLCSYDIVLIVFLFTLMLCTCLTLCSTVFGYYLSTYSVLVLSCSLFPPPAPPISPPLPYPTFPPLPLFPLLPFCLVLPSNVLFIMSYIFSVSCSQLVVCPVLLRGSFRLCCLVFRLLPCLPSASCSVLCFPHFFFTLLSSLVQSSPPSLIFLFPSCPSSHL